MVEEAAPPSWVGLSTYGSAGFISSVFRLSPPPPLAVVVPELCAPPPPDPGPPAAPVFPAGRMIFSGGTFGEDRPLPLPLPFSDFGDNFPDDDDDVGSSFGEVRLWLWLFPLLLPFPPALLLSGLLLPLLLLLNELTRPFSFSLSNFGECLSGFGDTLPSALLAALASRSKREDKVRVSFSAFDPNIFASPPPYLGESRKLISLLGDLFSRKESNFGDSFEDPVLSLLLLKPLLLVLLSLELAAADTEDLGEVFSGRNLEGVGVSSLSLNSSSNW